MFPEMDRRILKHVDNYHLHLIVPHEIEKFERFQTSLREVFEVIKASDDRKKMQSVIESNPHFECLENEAVSAINVFTGLNISIDKKEGKTNMCKAWKDQWLDGKAEGREGGREEGRREDIIRMLKNKKTPEQIAEFCDYDLEYVKSIQQEILQQI